MMINSPAIVIHSLRYSEADLIVTLFTKTNGLQTYIQKGVLKSKRGKIRASFFQPLTILEIEASHRNKGTLERIKDARVLSHYASLHTDVIKSALVFFISDILKSSIQEEEANLDLFEYLQTTILWLDTHDTIGNFHIAFLTKLTQYLGFYPDDSNLNDDCFNMQEGIFQSEDTNIYCVSGNHISKFKEFLGTTFEGSMNIRLSKNTRSEILTMLLVYFELHLHGFKKPKSLSVLNEIFT
ncbi:DNA repair protein RecO [Aquimarina sp. D1M17]|uniref:DNA repair protein RecO n=1 Tax=Aquimarina acroporae TaxID=2937283 RepID=UPI0020C10C60|nr:DNA repair protein RecO [Aquimarina acroporae]MCK8523120.1 DNA repair protein RecO [Aquimarina acroporae]